MRSGYVAFSREHPGFGGSILLDPHYDDPTTWYIRRVEVHRCCRREGLATQMMREMCAQADDEGIKLRLIVLPSGDMTEEQLLKWYERFGFKAGSGFYSLEMIRQPEGSGDVQPRQDSCASDASVASGST